MKKPDYFEKLNTVPDYKDVETLTNFITARMRIVSRERSGVNAKNQRKLSKAIKYARYLALIPTISYQAQ
ncbi:MAG: 30S ribosomal protein S18 [bacterium]